MHFVRFDVEQRTRFHVYIISIGKELAATACDIVELVIVMRRPGVPLFDRGLGKVRQDA